MSVDLTILEQFVEHLRESYGRSGVYIGPVLVKPSISVPVLMNVTPAGATLIDGWPNDQCLRELRAQFRSIQHTLSEAERKMHDRSRARTIADLEFLYEQVQKAITILATTQGTT